MGVTCKPDLNNVFRLEVRTVQLVDPYLDLTSHLAIVTFEVVTINSSTKTWLFQFVGYLSK